MAQVLSSIPLHGLDAVLVAVECALESGRPSGEHVMNILARLKEPVAQEDMIATPMVLKEEPVANVARYERLRTITPEANDVA
jgi:ribonuclease D